MIPFLVVKTRSGLGYVRPECVLAVTAGEPGQCVVLMTHGVAVEATEPAEDIIARLETQAREADEALRR